MERPPGKSAQGPLGLLGRRGGPGAGGGGLGEPLERDGFERSQAVSINKAINAQEVAVKEKHARTCILGTHHEKGAHTFWSVVNRLPLSSNAVLCWKFCHVFHKLLRDGHSNVLKDSVRYKSELSDMSRMWGHLSEGYGQLCSIYLKLLRTKMEFHTKNPRFPGNLQMSDRQLDETGENDVNNFFQLTVEMFDYLECELTLFQTVFSSLDMSRSVSVTATGQCRLAPLIQVILDCSHLYDYTVKLLFKLHSCLPADTLQGHRDRFLEQFKKLKDLFYRSSNLQYFKRLIQIPQLPENPPNFLRASALSEHISPVVVIPVEASSPDSEPIMDLVEMETSSQQNLFDNKFDDIFGSSFSSDPFNFNSQNGMTKDDKDRLIEQLHREISALKEELSNFKAESHRLVVQLKGRISELEAELAEQQHLKQQALDESDFLRTELDDLKKRHEDTEKAQRSLTEIERKAQATEQRYTKLKEKYSELVQNHADLLRKNAEVTRQVTVARQVQGDAERDKKELEDSLHRLSDQAQRKTQEQAEVLETLRRELLANKQEVQALRGTLESSVQSEAEHSTLLANLQQERATLADTVNQRDQQVAALEAGVQQLKATLESQAESSRKATQELQSRLQEKERDTKALQEQLLGKQFALLQCTVKEAEKMVQDALNRLEDPAHVSCTSSADYLLSRTVAASECTERLQEACSQYLSDQSDVGTLLPCVSLFAHLMGDTILQASATSHMAPMESADLLLEASRQCGAEALGYLGALKDRATLEGADCASVRTCLSRIAAIGEDLRPKGLDVEQERLGDLVDQEMAATAAAIETAATRIEEMLSKSRAGDTGVKLEVNERILGSCTELMQAIQVLVLASKDLQREIVESGRGAASPKEFYARNSRWTEGLISASKAVGWGATVLVDAADLVVQGKGKFEELMVCSHEIAASTAQLVAASKVKADKDSANLSKLQVASRGVNQATARVVACTKSGKSQIQETDSMDFSAMTLTQIKRQEMDSQVRVLELESQLQKERQHLGDLRRKHYELAGVAEGWDENGANFAP
ncbi:huntingtin-interacting protein 1 isoform X2 [Sceloporus undulatus]|uniref:huntingtin-interacting protein 1 isoform X2 n=1 Tax=Sceloporus undulatus TaxID=8520 RepID=UPI001C4C44A6|nr:huntingtin-interacting protein 1 isoform X2 [Sceloporus undulatus]